MPQFLINPSTIKDNVAIITGSDARHITTVLRLKAGDWLMLTDGEGHRWRAEIKSATPKLVTALVAAELALPNLSKQALTLHAATSITLAQAIIKHDRFEWIIQKAVELGCSKIIPFTSERTIPKFQIPPLPPFLPPNNAADSQAEKGGKRGITKLARWQKIADEAAKQCGTSIRPIVNEPLKFAELLKQFQQFEEIILFWEGESVRSSVVGLQSSATPTTDNQRPTTIIIGPEGGFSADEVKMAKTAGAVTCGLGPLILRVETAAITGLTLVQNRLGYFK